MRILNVIHTVNPVAGGPGEGLRQMVQATLKLGHRQEVLTLDGPSDDWVSRFPGRIHAIGPVSTTYAYHPGLLAWLKTRAQDYDALIVHGLWQYHGLAVRWAARAAGLPYFVYTHGMLDPWFKHFYPLKHLKKWLYWPWGDYRVLRDARGVLFTAEEEPRLAAQSFRLYKVRELVVGYGLALDPLADEARADDFHQLFPRTRGRRLVLFLGRLHEKKGCDLLVEAFARVAALEPSLMLVMAGPDHGGLRVELERLAARLGVTQRIVWTGMLSGSTKWSAFKAAEVFTLPSHQENFGIAVAEALAVGIPVLISRRINIWREIVTHDAGFAAEDDLAGTVSLLERWLRLSAGERSAMSQRALDCYQARFHVDAAAQRLVSTLDQAIAGSPRIATTA